MSTRALIAIFDKGIYRGISLHFDGSIGFAGKTLKEHYTTKNKVDKLISRGNLEYLDANLKKCVQMDGETVETEDKDELFRCFDWEYAYIFEKPYDNIPEYFWYVYHIKMVREEL